MNGVLRPINNRGHIGHTCILKLNTCILKLNTSAKWKLHTCATSKTNMINEEWNKTQNDAPFVAFYDMHAVTFVLPDEMADVSIAGL